MRISLFALSVALCMATAPVFSSAAIAKDVPVQVVPKDYVTADGSLRVGLHNGKMYGVLTAAKNKNVRVELSPDSWSGDQEAKSWDDWLVKFDGLLYSKWADNATVDGQETVLVTVENGVITQDAAQYFGGAGSDPQTFSAAISASLAAALKDAPTMPTTKNPLKAIHMAMTFMRDSKMMPRVGRETLGFMAVAPDGQMLTVYGRTGTDGREPGIQLRSDETLPHGTIKVTDDATFRANCAANGVPTP